MDSIALSNRYGRSWYEGPLARDRSDCFSLIAASPRPRGQAFSTLRTENRTMDRTDKTDQTNAGRVEGRFFFMQTGKQVNAKCNLFEWIEGGVASVFRSLIRVIRAIRGSRMDYERLQSECGLDRGPGLDFEGQTDSIGQPTRESSWEETQSALVRFGLSPPNHAAEWSCSVTRLTRSPTRVTADISSGSISTS
jgi:hypothetical protein